MRDCEVHFEGFDLDWDNQPGGAVVRFSIRERKGGSRILIGPISLPVGPSDDGISGMISRAHYQLSRELGLMAEQAEQMGKHYAEAPAPLSQE